jgi:thioredoxin-related protein
MRGFALSRRNSLQLAGASLLVAAGMGTARAEPAHLPSSSALADDLKKALADGSPLLVMVSLEGCPFCKIVRENYLGPMQQRDGLPVVQIDMRNKAVLKDFKGNTLTQDELIRSWGVRVAPTVLFFGRGGVEVAERMVGGYIPDFYGPYLDDRLLAARAAVHSKK